ncbi:MAG: FecR domain-containing protein [Deltaproteobacteria bacterium]|nr:FecR domain-containing protein [Deltaproteobacteria bacterium]
MTPRRLVTSSVVWAAAVLAGCDAARPMRFAVARGDVRQDGEAVWSGAPVAAGDLIEVGAGCAEVEIEGVGSVRLYSNTRLALVASRKQSRVRLVAGQLWALVAGARTTESFEVETANAVLGVRGTEFVVEERDAVTEVRVKRGKVAVANRRDPKATRELGAGQRAAVKKGEPPSAAVPYDDGFDDRLWARPVHAFAEVKEVVKEGAKTVGESVKEAAPDVKRGLKKGALRLRDGARELFKK